MRDERRPAPGKRALRTSQALLVFVGLALASRSAFAYIDPGTGQQLWTSLAPILGILLACLSVALVPVRFFWSRIGTAWRRVPKRLRRAALIGIGAIVVGLGCWGAMALFGQAAPAQTQGGEMSRRGTFKRVVVMGMDGLDPNLLEKWMNAGKLPHFSKLRSAGTFARLQTSIPPESPVAWLCASTGVNPGRHGVFDFIGRNPKTYLPDLSLLKTESKGPLGLSGQGYVSPTDARPFWRILSDHGIENSVIRWPATFPPQPVNGRLLSGLGTPDVTGTLGQYAFYTTDKIAGADKAPDRVRLVAWNGDGIETDLAGPAILSLGSQKLSTVPLRIARSVGAGAIRLTVADAASFSLKEGQWSEWTPVEFPGGLSRKCPAMVRFHLASVEPALKLYASPVCIDPAHPAFPITHPADFSGELAGEIGRYATLGLPEDTQAVRHGRISLKAFLEDCGRITREREAMLERELKRFDSGLLAVIFDTSDRIQHMFWAANDPTHPSHTPELEREFGDVIEEHYRRMDSALGKVLDRADDDTAVFVLSDHGFTSFKRAVHLNTWLVRNGFMALEDGSNGEGATLLRSVDWAKTKAYAVGFCSLYVNLKGREGKGVVTDGQERRQVIEELTQALRAWKDPAAGDPVVSNAYVAGEVFQGGHLKDAPDIVVGYSPGYRASWQTAVGAAPKGEPLADNDDLWSGDHLVDPACVPGVFLSNVKCPVTNPRLIDVAPTVLKAFGHEKNADVDGKPLF